MLLYPMQPRDYSALSPLMRNQVYSSLVISIAPDNIYQTVNFIESVLSSFDPEHWYALYFVREGLQRLYASEVRLMTLTGTLAGICIFIATLGMYGLASFNTARRAKEVGIRRVLGASIVNIIALLAKNMLWLVVAASVCGSLVSFLVMDDWLRAFAYRTDIPLWAFLAATLAMAVVAFSTVAAQSYRSANANPADAIRYE